MQSGGSRSRRNSAAWSIALWFLTAVHPATAQASGELSADGAGTEQQVLVLNGELSATDTETGALQFSAQLEADGDLSGAAVVLERYLLEDQNAVMARAEYALLLCRLDDLEAGRFEGSKLASIPAEPDILARISAACGDAEASPGTAD